MARSPTVVWPDRVPDGIDDTLPRTVDHVAVARLYGEPLFTLPQDLYIPPDALEVFLETFQGPLDLLLYLIRRQNFNILDIPMADVTRQYLDYVDQIRNHNLELAADYLLMAATLIEIKSRMLLPPRRVDVEREAEDPRAELVRRLLEYERIKLGAAALQALPMLGRDMWRAQAHSEPSAQAQRPTVTAAELGQAWADVVQRASRVQHHHIRREALSVRETMSQLLRQLQARRYIEFQDLFEPHHSMALRVVSFVALLELARERLLEATQAEAYAPLYLRLAFQSAAQADQSPD